jgi:peptidoglycan/xylan/chitin deacetylase (PgdA/CDA1 family)
MLTLLKFVAVLSIFVSSLTCAQSVYVLKSQSSVDFFAQAGGDHLRSIDAWTTALSRLKQPVQLIDSNALVGLADRSRPITASTAEPPPVLILPSSVVLSKVDRDAINRLIARGWGILGSWAVGSRDENFNWTGYTFIADVFGAKVISDFDLVKANGWFLLPVGETPLTHNLGAGERIYLPKVADRLLLIQGQGAQIVARGGDWVRQAPMGAANAGLVSMAEQNGARRVFLGLPESAWGAAQTQVDALVKNSLSWLKREVTAVKGSWPHPHESALLIEMDTEDQFANAGNLMTLLEERKLTGTFYSLTSLAVKHPDIVKRIMAKHELAFHAEVHDGFKDLSLSAQENRLRQMQSQLDSIAPEAARAAGFRAPLESFDVNTEIALRKVGIKHHAGSPASSDIALPTFSSAEPNIPVAARLLVLPRTLLDDVNFANMGVRQSNVKENLMITGADDIHSLRGFALLSIHTQYFGAEMPLTKAFPAFLSSVTAPARRNWIAPATQIEQWWRGREQVALKTSVSGSKMAITLENQGAALAQFKVVVMLPTANANVTSSAGSVQIERLDDQRVAVVWPMLKPGASSLTLQFQ